MPTETSTAGVLHADFAPSTRACPAVLEVDLGRIEHNLGVLRGVLEPGCGLCAVVKADAYGMGAVPIARRLARAGVEMLCVYSLSQAAELVEAGLETPILVLAPVHDLSETGMPPRPSLMEALRARRVHFVVHSRAQAEALAASLPEGVRVPVHLEVNTGMNRGGLGPEEAGCCLAWLAASPRFELAAVMSHAASANVDPTYTARQLARLEDVLLRNRAHVPAEALVHFAASYAVLRNRDYHKRMVRVGLALLGYGPSEMRATEGLPLDLLPAVRLASRIVHTFEVEAGCPVGYCGSYVTERPSRLGLVPVGYAMGYPRALSNRSCVAVGAARVLAPVRGAVSMDQVTVDLTDVPEAVLGTVVDVVSNDPCSPLALDRLAALAGTNAHELLCRMGAAPRRYVG